MSGRQLPDLSELARARGAADVRLAKPQLTPGDRLPLVPSASSSLDYPMVAAPPVLPSMRTMPPAHHPSPRVIDLRPGNDAWRLLNPADSAGGVVSLPTVRTTARNFAPERQAMRSAALDRTMPAPPPIIEPPTTRVPAGTRAPFDTSRARTMFITAGGLACPDNPRRRYLAVINAGGATLWANLGQGAIVGQCIPILAGGAFIMDHGVSIDAVYVTPGKAFIIEGMEPG